MVLEMASKAVFVDTNIGTHIVVPVSPEIKDTEFKGELERFHVHCCPEVGNIMVKRLMVKKRSRYYELPESMPLKYLFCRSDATWFIHAIITKNQVRSSETESFNCKSTNDVTLPVKLNCSLPCKKVRCRRKKTKRRKLLRFRAPQFKPFRLACLSRRKRKRKKRCKLESVSTLATTAEEVICSQERDSRNVTETINENLSEPESVSGIIEKYFLDYDEGASNPRSNQKILNSRHGFASPVTDASFKISKSLCNNKPAAETSGLECKKPEVGKRLLHASNSLGLSPSAKQFAASLCKFSNRKAGINKCSVATKSLVFEIPEESD